MSEGNVWRLMVWDVPDRLGGLLSRLSFKPTKKNPAHWWRLFDPARDKEVATRIRSELLAAGLRGSWQEMDDQKPKPKPTPPPQFPPTLFVPKTSRSSGLSANLKNSSNRRRRGHGRRGF